MKAFRTAAVLLISILFLTGCGKDESTADSLKATASLSVSSESLHGGVWDEIITNTQYGENLSPQLTIGAVPNAESYAVYMLDESAGNWLHWYINGLTDTELEQGAEPNAEFAYIGPYPPSGTHTYTVYAFALKQTPDNSCPAEFNKQFMPISELYSDYLDIAGGQSGNVISYGYVSGTYTFH